MTHLVCMLNAASTRLFDLEAEGISYNIGAVRFFGTYGFMMEGPFWRDNPGAKPCCVNNGCADEELMRNYIHHPEKEVKNDVYLPSSSG